MKQGVYIRSAGLISPQKTGPGFVVPEQLNPSADGLFRCLEPDYREYLNPVMARRMGRLIKMGIASALMCLKDAGVEQPDAIVTGTGLGCLGETEKFLMAIIRDDEQFLTPTSFIQSLQNSVAGQIALHLGCNQHNFTFVHRGFSFENALLDAMMLIEEGAAGNVLTGGLDEMTENNFRIYRKLGHWKNEAIPYTSLIGSGTPGTVGGEGAAFFMLSATPDKNSAARLLGIRMLQAPENTAKVFNAVEHLLGDHHLSANNIDLVLYGHNGDRDHDAFYESFRETYFPETAAATYKQLCGEYQTSGGFAMWLAASVLQNNRVPPGILMNQVTSTGIKNILVFSGYQQNKNLLLLRGA